MLSALVSVRRQSGRKPTDSQGAGPMENFRIADRVKDPSLHLKKKPETHETFWICKATYGLFLINFFFKIFRQKRREEERERNSNVWLPLARPLQGTWPTTQACALTGIQTDDLLLSRLALNPLSHTRQG